MTKVQRWSLPLLITLWAGSVSPLAAADEAEIRRLVDKYVEAFNQQDLAGVSSCWAQHATHTDRETGERTEGREAIQADLAAAFQQRPDMRLNARVDNVRFIKPDIVSIDGQTSVGTADEEPSISAFTAILVREGESWLIDSIEEMPLPIAASSHDALEELEWLVGKWVDASSDGRVETTFRWTPNRAFLLRSFVLQSDQEVTLRGTQVIGWDPRSRQIRSWSFNSDGSFGDANWSRNGEEWLIKSSQTLASGDAASGTYVLSRQDDNSFTMQLIGHDIEGEPQPTGKTVTIVRVADPSSANTPSDQP